MIAAGNKAEPHGINVEGLRRRGFSADAISALRSAYRLLYKNGLSFEEAKVQLRELASRWRWRCAGANAARVCRSVATRHHPLTDGFEPESPARRDGGGEPSGDLLAASLLDGLASRLPAGTRYYRVGGPRMIATGFDAHWPMEKLTVRGYVEALRHIPEILGIRKELKRQLLAEPPSVFVGVDAPDFNFGLEHPLRERVFRRSTCLPIDLGVARGRIKKIAKAVDHMLCVFPFETALSKRPASRLRMWAIRLPTKFLWYPTRLRRAPHARPRRKRSDHRGVAGQPALGDRSDRPDVLCRDGNDAAPGAQFAFRDAGSHARTARNVRPLVDAIPVSR